MRGVFWALVLINIIGGGWLWWSAQTGSGVKAPAVAANTAAPVAETVAPVAEIVAPIEGVVTPAVAGVAESAVGVTTEVEVVTSAGARLVLLEELRDTQLESMVREKQRLRMETVSAATAVADEKPLCKLVGAFADVRKAQNFVEHLRALDVAAAVQKVEVPGESAFWVYLPPALSKKEALRLLHELQNKKIDSFVIPKGEQANGISLGLFSTPNAAQLRQQEIIDQGYQALIEERERTYEEIWVVLTGAEAGKLSETLWQELLSKEVKLDIRQNFCPDVASE